MKQEIQAQPGGALTGTLRKGGERFFDRRMMLPLGFKGSETCPISRTSYWWSPSSVPALVCCWRICWQKVRPDVLTPLGTLPSVPCSLKVMQEQFTYKARHEGLGRAGAKQTLVGMFGGVGSPARARKIQLVSTLSNRSGHLGMVVCTRTRSLLTRTHLVSH